MSLLLPARPKSGHKGTFGTVAVAGGSIDDDKVMLGSAAFTAKAAIRSGAGLAVFLGDKKLLVELIEMVPQAVGTVLDKNLSGREKWQSVIIGPGMGLRRENVPLVRRLLSLNIPTVIDADGLNTIAENPALAEKLHDKCVLTPHKGEFERLAKAFGISDVKDMASKFDCIITLKSSETLVTDGKTDWRNQTENPALATGGTGDVLAGLIGGLMAQFCPKQLSAYDCTRLGAEIYSMAGIKWKQKHGTGGLLIDELLELIPAVMQKMRG